MARRPSVGHARFAARPAGRRLAILIRVNPRLASRASIAIYLASCVLFLVALHAHANGWVVSNVAPGLGAPGLDAARGTRTGLVHVAVLGLAFLGMVTGYGLMLLSVLRASVVPSSSRSAFIIAVAAALPLLMTPYLLSTDVYGYILYGRVHAVHDGNPYTTPPYLFDDPYQEWVYWREAAMIYGPIWLYVSSGLTAVLDRLGAGPALHVVAFKVLALGLHLGSGALIVKIVRRRRPDRAHAAALAYLLNPLCLIEFAGNAHNDVAVIFLVLCAIDAHAGHHRWRAVTWLVLATLAKPYALGLLGLYVAGHVREAPSRTVAVQRGAASMALVALVCTLAYAPVWDGLATFRGMTRDAAASGEINSIAQWLTSLGTSRTVARAIMFGGFAVLALFLLLRSRSAEQALRGFPWFMLGFCALGAAWFWPWYATMAVAMAVALGTRSAVIATLILSACALIIYVTFALGAPSVVELRSIVRALHDGRAVVVFGPAALVLVWSWLRHPHREVLPCDPPPVSSSLS